MEISAIVAIVIALASLLCCFFSVVGVAAALGYWMWRKRQRNQGNPNNLPGSSSESGEQQAVAPDESGPFMPFAEPSPSDAVEQPAKAHPFGLGVGPFVDPSDDEESATVIAPYPKPGLPVEEYEASFRDTGRQTIVAFEDDDEGE